MSSPDRDSRIEKSADELKKEAELGAAPRGEEDIYRNYATPLIGQFLNLPLESVEIQCPACGVKELSRVENDLKWWAVEVNRIFGCLFVVLCCCCCFNYYIPCKQTDLNHYCKNCGCYFGRSMKRKQIRVTRK